MDGPRVRGMVRVKACEEGWIAEPRPRSHHLDEGGGAAEVFGLLSPIALAAAWAWMNVRIAGSTPLGLMSLSAKICEIASFGSGARHGCS